MGRKRQIVVDQDEDIVSYEHNLVGKFVRVLVGVGTSMPDSSFIVSENQTFESYIIDGVEYDNLMSANGNKPVGVFRREDLWPSVDQQRTKIKEERESKNVELENNTQERI